MLMAALLCRPLAVLATEQDQPATGEAAEQTQPAEETLSESEVSQPEADNKTDPVSEDKAEPDAISENIIPIEQDELSMDQVQAEEAAPAGGETEENTVSSGTCGGYTFNYDNITRTLTIEGTGELERIDIYGNLPWTDSSNTNKVPWIKYVEHIVFKSTGMKDASRLFWHMANVKTIDLSGFDTSQVTTMEGMFQNCDNLTGLDLSKFNTGNVTNMKEMFEWCGKLTSLDLSNFDTSNVTDMHCMLQGCYKLTTLDISSFNTANVTDMQGMFAHLTSMESIDLKSISTDSAKYMHGMFGWCENLKSLDITKFNTQNVTAMSRMFYECKALEKLDVSHLNTSNVTTMQEMFSGCRKLKNIDVTGFDTHNVTTMSGMFQYCNALESIDVSKFDTHKVTAMNAMFEYCTTLKTLDLSHFDTSTNLNGISCMVRGCSSLTNLDISSLSTDKVYDMTAVFSKCEKLTSIDVSKFDTHNVTNFYEMFEGCTSLKSLDLSSFDTKNANYMRFMFKGCSSLSELNLSNFNTEKVTSFEDMFKDCKRLRKLNISGFDMRLVSSGDGSDILSGSDHLTALNTPAYTVYEIPLSLTMYEALDEEGKGKGTGYTSIPVRTGESLTLYAPEKGDDPDPVNPDPDKPDPDKPAVVLYTLTFMVGDTVYKSVKVNAGETPDEIEDPKGEGTFAGWFENGKLWDATAPVYADATIVARFITDKVSENKPGVSPLDPLPDVTEQTSSLRLVKGQKFTLSENDWVSSDKNIVAVNKGSITAKKAGSATLTREGRTINVTVLQPAYDKDHKKFTMYTGRKEKLALSDADGFNLLWASSAPDVANVTTDGTVCATGKGSAKITAYINGVAFNCNVTVKDADTSKRSFNEGDEIQLAPMQTVKVSVKGFKANKAEWSSDHQAVSADDLGKNVVFEDGIVRITKDGKITGIGTGQTALTSAKGGKDLKFKVTVSSVPLRIVHMNKNTSKTLSMYGTKGTLDWKASKENIVKINAKNRIRGTETGKTELSANYGKFTYRVVVYVEDPSLTTGGLTGKYPNYKLNMKAGDAVLLQPVKTYQPMIFKSSNKNAAIADESGVVYARKKGKAKLTAVVNKKTVTVSLTVK